MRRGMICAPQPEAVDAGADVLRAGGNAVDAAIACAFVQGVVDPLMTGIAGFGSMTCHLPSAGALECFDFHAPAPAAARPGMWESLVEGEARDGFGFFLTGRVNELGYQSVAVPTALKGYHEAHRAHGRMPWRDLLRPAIDYALAGWAVRPHVEAFWSEEGTDGRLGNPERIRFSATGRRLYCRPDGSPRRTGETIRNPDLAAVLEAIAADGPDAFYRGDVAAAIARDHATNGGLLTRDDLASATVIRRPPLRGRYRGVEIATNNPPGGGVTLLQMLAILEHFDLGALEHNSAEYIRVVSEAMKLATADKDAHVGDPDFSPVPVDMLLDAGRARDRAARIRSGERAVVDRLEGGLPARNTTHVSVVDRDGASVSLTHSLGQPSGVITDGLGFMYNGCMSVFDPRPGRRGSIAPGKRRFSSMCPSILFRDGRPFLVIGAPGATQIAMGVLQVVLNVVDHGMGVVEAVVAPRFSSTSNRIDVSNRISRHVTRELEAAGFDVARSAHSYGGFAAVHAIMTRGGSLSGGADPWHDGMALAV